MSESNVDVLEPIGVPPKTRERSLGERLMGLMTTVNAGEGKGIARFFVYAFVLLVCYYVLKTIREPLLLAGGSAELKSYAYAAIAAVLVVLVPLYGALFRRTDPLQLTRWITAAFAASLTPFYVLGRAGVDVGFAYYVWVGVFAVAMLAQFWAHAANSFNLESGQRLFPVIMTGAALGGLAGPRVASALYPVLGPWNLLLVAIGLLVATLPLVERTTSALPRHARAQTSQEPAPTHWAGGFALVLRDRYLLLLAVLAVLLNCVNTTGEYLLADFVKHDAAARVAADPTLDQGALIAAFYGNYYFATNALSLTCQALLVARVFRWVGVNRAILVLPLVALAGYGLIVFAPLFAIVHVVKLCENSVNYSLMNTARHALYLPLSTAQQYEGKTTVDTVFWRAGDLLQAGVIFAGLHWLGFGAKQFAVLNLLFAAAWVVVTLRVGNRYPRQATRRPTLGWRPLLVGACGAAVAAVALPGKVAAQRADLFGEAEPLALELTMATRSFCRDTTGDKCDPVPATLTYRDADGAEHRIDAQVRARGKWRADGGNCVVPPLFVAFPSATIQGTPFDGQSMLPLTTHCRDQAEYEQYVLKEYLAYRIYGLFTDKSLRVRLARITYRFADGRHERTDERYGFFAEHFDSLAARQGGRVLEPEAFEPLQADQQELATLEVFQYMIGNTDWSAVRGHNVAVIRDAAGLATAVPYDFDFSGLVNASYAGPSPLLPIKRVTQRLFRGFCRAGFDWQPVFERFEAQRDTVANLIASTPGLVESAGAQARRYVDLFYETLGSAKRRAGIVAACRAGPV